MLVFVLLFWLWACVFVQHSHGYIGQYCRWNGCQRNERCNRRNYCECMRFSHSVGKPGREHCGKGFVQCEYDEDCYGEAKCIIYSYYVHNCEGPSGYHLTKYNMCVLNTGVWIGIVIGILVGVGILTYGIVRFKRWCTNKNCNHWSQHNQSRQPQYPYVVSTQPHHHVVSPTQTTTSSTPIYTTTLIH